MQQPNRWFECRFAVQLYQNLSSLHFEAFESEDTFSILDRYIQESEINMDKTIIQKMIREVYQEACEMV